MLIKLFSRELQCSVIVAKRTFKCIRINLLSVVQNVSGGKPHVNLRPYVTEVSETKLNETLPQFAQNGHMTYYRQYLLSNPDFNEIIFREELISDNTNTSSSLSKKLRELSSKEEVVQEDLEFMLSCEEELKNLTYFELLETLNLFGKLKRKKDEKFVTQLSCLENEMLRRNKSLSINEKLRILDCAYQSRYIKNIILYHLIKVKYVSNCQKLTNPQFVYLCYLLTYKKSLGSRDMKLFNLKREVCNRISLLRMEDIGIICNAFYQNEINLTKAIPFIMDKVKNELNDTPMPVIFSICRVLMYCFKKGITDIMIGKVAEFQELLIPKLTEFTNIQLIQLAYSGYNYNYINMTVFKEIMNRVKHDITTFSLVDFSRVTYLMAKFNIDDEEFLKLALNEFEKRDDLQRQLPAYFKFLRALMFFKIYPKNLLERVYTNEVLKSLKKEGKKNRAFSSALTVALKLEIPEFKFDEKLDKKLFSEFTKSSWFITQSYNHDIYFKQFVYMLNNIYGRESVFLIRPAVHIKDCILMVFDKNLKTQKLKENLKELPRFYLKTPNDDHIWVFISLLKQDAYADVDCKTFNYMMEEKIRHLSILGYKIVLIRVEDIKNKMRITPENQSFVKCLIEEKLQDFIR